MAVVSRFLKYAVTISSAALIVFAIPSQEVKATTVSPVKMELSANPGETIHASLKITNESQTSETLYTVTLNFEPKGDESGEPRFIPTKDGLAAWVSTDPTITLGPKEQKKLDFSIKIPKDTEPGGYFGALFVSTNPPATDEDGSVALAERVGGLILLRVNGNLEDSGDILEFNTQNKRWWFTSLPIDLYYRFQNSGSDRVQPLGDILVKNWLNFSTRTIAANPNGGNVLPKSIRRFEASWSNDSRKAPEPGFLNNVRYELRNFAFGEYSLELNLAYGTGSLKTATARTSVFVFPWHLILSALILLGAITGIGNIMLRIYNRRIITRYEKRQNKK